MVENNCFKPSIKEIKDTPSSIYLVRTGESSVRSCFLRVAKKQISIVKRVINTITPVTQMIITPASTSHIESKFSSVMLGSGAVDTTLPEKFNKIDRSETSFNCLILVLQKSREQREHLSEMDHRWFATRAAISISYH